MSGKWVKGRWVDPELIAAVQGCPCIACTPGTQRTKTQAHHVTTRANKGGDTAVNVMGLCEYHHIGVWHKQGLNKLIDMAPSVKFWLESAGRTDILDALQFKNENDGRLG